MTDDEFKAAYEQAKEDEDEILFSTIEHALENAWRIGHGAGYREAVDDSYENWKQG